MVRGNFRSLLLKHWFPCSAKTSYGSIECVSFNKSWIRINQRSSYGDPSPVQITWQDLLLASWILPCAMPALHSLPFRSAETPPVRGGCSGTKHSKWRWARLSLLSSLFTQLNYWRKLSSLLDYAMNQFFCVCTTHWIIWSIKQTDFQRTNLNSIKEFILLYRYIC